MKSGFTGEIRIPLPYKPTICAPSMRDCADTVADVDIILTGEDGRSLEQHNYWKHNLQGGAKLTFAVSGSHSISALWSPQEAGVYGLCNTHC
ncbi:unnamed protein product [Nezara viridula]|uniref:Uncharacterized protein n=1 Tax=Nezara viridula TaxID=85310 RepID=A0A9P0HQY1_NEZVI|nr:unnamed protein product [Nezara viridula]